MARIDYYVKTLAKFHADAVVLQSNAAVLLRFASGDRAAAQTTPHADLVALVREAMPPEVSARFGPNRTLNFAYSCEGTTVGIVVEAAATTLKVSVLADPAAAGIPPRRDVPAIASPATGVSAPSLASAFAPGYPPGPAGAMGSDEQSPSSSPGSPDDVPNDTTDYAGDAEQLLIERTSYADERAEATRRGATAQASSAFAGLISAARRAGATDLLLAAGAPPLLRVRGDLRSAGSTEPLADLDVRVAIEEALGTDALRRLDERGAASSVMTVGGVGRVRVRAVRGQQGHALVAHPVPSGALLTPAIAALARESGGLILAAGPAGSGRTATLQALAEAMGARPGLMVLVGDPIEVEPADDRPMTVRQSVGVEVADLPSALRAAAGLSPLLVVAGDVDDGHALRAAFEAAEAGPLVLAALACSSATAALARVTGALGGDGETGRARVDATVRGVVVHQRRGDAVTLELKSPPFR
jgi:twitching motility protein PilT